MALQSTVTLQTIRCLSQGESSGSEPYIWPFLASTATGPGSFDTTPTAAILADSRKVIASSMKAGASAPLIFPGNVVGHTFAEGQSECTQVLVVALMEADDNRVPSMQAGYQAYLDELRSQLGHKVLALKTAPPEERKIIIDEIKKAVKKKAKDAVVNSLSDWEKTKILIGAMDTDDFLAFDYALLPNIEASAAPPQFTLHLVGTGESQGFEFEIDGVVNVAQTEPNRCQVEADAVAAAHQAIDALEGQIRLLQHQLHTATPQQKPAIIKAIEKIRTEQLPAAQETLLSAEGALLRCEAMHTRPGPVDQPVAPIVG
jgi:hypothetical protein